MTQMTDVKEYDWIIVGTGSASNLYNSLLQADDDAKIAVIDKDIPGGICLTRGCVPSKMLVYPAEIIRTIEHAKSLGINAEYEADFKAIMERMRNSIGNDIDHIRQGLTNADDIDYYHQTAEFVDEYTMEVGGSIIQAKHIILCLGSTPLIPDIENLDEVDYITSRGFLQLQEQPEQMVVIGGGYIAAEYSHFLSAMGTEVTIFGRNPQFLPGIEPEVAQLAKNTMNQWIDIQTNHEVFKVEQDGDEKIVYARDQESGEIKSVICDTILIAAGRGSLSDLIHPERSGIEVDEQGWIMTDEQMHTSKEGIWAFGDANGKYLYKHAGNAEASVALYNIFGHEHTMSYHAVPYAVFTYPEIAAVGMTQAQAEEHYGEDGIVIGFQQYEHTAKGKAMNLKDYFVKVILDQEEHQILGAHIIGPHASELIQEIIDLMNTEARTPAPIYRGMHIHPALPEVVERAFGGYLTPDEYANRLGEVGLSPRKELVTA